LTFRISDIRRANKINQRSRVYTTENLATGQLELVINKNNGKN